MKIMAHRTKHLYRRGAKKRELRSFKHKYGRKGAYIYGAVVGKVKRERAKKTSQTHNKA